MLTPAVATMQAALAPLRAASAAGASREPLLPLAPFAKYASDALSAGAKPWEGPPVLLSGVGADTADQPFWVRIMRRCCHVCLLKRRAQGGHGAAGARAGAGREAAAGDATAELASLRAQLDAARAEAERWRALHGELRTLVADQL
jgi:hypothetical protein